MRSLPTATPAYDRGNEQTARTLIERAIGDLERPVQEYTVPATSSGSPVRELPSSPTLTQVSDFLITFINDLKAAGRVK
jgi:hypothetical protein